MNPLKLICEYDFGRFDYDIILEQKNNSSDKTYKIRGPYIVAEQKNANGRVYKKSVVESAVNKYYNEFINQNRALGELNHSDNVDVNLDRACHMVTSLKEQNNTWIGESQVLRGTPTGDILLGLLNNGVKIGMSTRGVGDITDNKVVTDYNLISVDVVSNPSAPGCFVEGILESKQFMIDAYGKLVEYKYEQLEENLKKLPNTIDEKTVRIREIMKEFLANI